METTTTARSTISTMGSIPIDRALPALVRIPAAPASDICEEFPAVIGDDRFVQGQFAPAERATVDEAGCVVRPPRTVAALLARGARNPAGTRE